MAKRSGAAISKRQYSQFRGADFSTDQSLVDYSRSPLCTNIVADGGGMPQKRLGWRTVKSFTGAIHGIYRLEHNGVQRMIHAGTGFYKEDGTLLATAPDRKSRGVYLGGAIWIVTGDGFFRWDGETVSKVRNRYSPTTTITREPEGGGVSFEAVNMLSPYRKNAFQTDGTAVTFLLDATIDATGEVKAWVWGEETTAFTVNRDEGTITMTTAPRAPYAGAADGLVVEFPHTVEGYAERIDKCTICTVYGLGSNDRLVLGGNPDLPNVDWISDREEPGYIPDLSYSVVGTADTAIMGYLPIGSYLGIIKEDNGQDAGIYLRSGTTDEDGEAVFSIQQAVTGVGAIAKGCFGALLDDPLFLSRAGVMALTSNSLTSKKLTTTRSDFLNPQLLQEDLRSGEAIVWDTKYLIAFKNGHIYGLDARQDRSYRSSSSWEYRYEGFYWENVPATCWMADGEELWFGTVDGKLCRMNTDINGMAKYSDDGEAIDAVWATKYDDDGSPQILKTMLKRGCCVTIKPFTRSSGTVYFRTDRTGGEQKRIAGKMMDILDFTDIDFERFTFSADDGPQDIFLNRKVKNYKRMQIIIRNSEKDEGFGVFQITKTYVNGNYAKR